MQKFFAPLVVALLLLLGCSEDDSPTRPNDFTPLTSIEIVSQNPAIANGTSNQFTAIGNFSGLFTRDITGQVLWESSMPAVAGISNDPTTAGRATAVSAGTTIISATVEGVPAASFQLVVTDAVINALAISPVEPNTPRGLSVQFSAVGTFSDATSQDLTFDVLWDSSDPLVATIGNAPGDKGLARALATGLTTISATFGSLTQSTPMTVTDPALQSITVEPANASQLSLTRRSYTARGSFSDGTTADISSQVNWSSTNTQVAEIDAATGQVTTLAQGNTTIRATFGGVSASTGLTATGGNLTSIQIQPVNPASLVHPTGTPAGQVGMTRRMTAMGSFSNGRQRDITEMATWAIRPAGVTEIEVSNNSGERGLLRTRAATTVPTTLAATFRTIESTAGVSVLSGSLTGLQVTPLTSNIAVGTSTRFQVTGTFNVGQLLDLTHNAVWSVTGTAASVDSSLYKEGRLRGVQAGTGTVSANFGSQTANATLTVTNRTLQGLNVGPTILSTAVGGSLQLNATADYADGSSQVVTEDVDWSLDNTNVAIFADASRYPGLVYGVNVGSTTLTARFGNFVRTFTLNVLQ